MRECGKIPYAAICYPYTTFCRLPLMSKVFLFQLRVGMRRNPRDIQGLPDRLTSLVPRSFTVLSFRVSSNTTCSCKPIEKGSFKTN